MPGPRHQFAAHLIRDNPDLPRYLLRANRIRVPNGTASVVDSNLSLDEHGLDLPEQLQREKRADVLTTISDDERTHHIIISEPQGSRPDHRKKAQWVCYIGAAGFVYGCPVKLLVLALNDEAAAACQVTFPTGHPSLLLTPVTVWRFNTPDPDTAGGERFVLQVTMLCVINGKFDLVDSDTRNYVLRELAAAEPELRTSYTRNLWRICDFALRLALEVDFMATTYGIPILDGAFNDGVKEGKTQGVSAGMREMLIHILEARGLQSDDEARKRVNSCDDRDQLEAWADNALTANSIEDVFK